MPELERRKGGGARELDSLRGVDDGRRRLCYIPREADPVGLGGARARLDLLGAGGSGGSSAAWRPALVPHLISVALRALAALCVPLLRALPGHVLADGAIGAAGLALPFGRKASKLVDPIKDQANYRAREEPGATTDDTQGRQWHLRGE